MLPWPRRWPIACSGLPTAAAASFSIELRLPVGVARCFSSRVMRLGAPCIGAGMALFPSRLDRARSWFFFDLKRNAMVNQEAAAGGEVAALRTSEACQAQKQCLKFRLIDCVRLRTGRMVLSLVEGSGCCRVRVIGGRHDRQEAGPRGELRYGRAGRTPASPGQGRMGTMEFDGKDGWMATGGCASPLGRNSRPPYFFLGEQDSRGVGVVSQHQDVRVAGGDGPSRLSARRYRRRRTGQAASVARASRRCATSEGSGDAD